MKRDCEKFLKVYDSEYAGNLILILGLETENIAFSLSKHLVAL
jgi:hypothetical protein